MKATYSEKKQIKNNVNNESYIQELCDQSPFLIINTPCGVGKYKFNKIGYDNNNSLVLEYILIRDDKYKDSKIYFSNTWPQYEPHKQKNNQ